mgnify:FL=1
MLPLILSWLFSSFSMASGGWQTEYCTPENFCTSLEIEIDFAQEQLNLTIPELDRCVQQHAVPTSTAVPVECTPIINHLPRRPGFADQVRGWAEGQTGLKITGKGLRVNGPNGLEILIKPERRGVRITIPF